MLYRRIFHLTVLCLLGAAVLLTACGGGNASTNPTPEQEVAEPYAEVVSATGVVLPAQKANLSMLTSGVVAEVLVNEGQLVESGQVLLRLEGREQLEANLAQAQFELVNARQAYEEVLEDAGLVRAQVEMELANARDDLEDAEYKRTVRQEGNRASQATLDGARANLILAEEEVEEAKEQYDKVSGKREDNLRRALALSNLSAARKQLDSVQRNLNWYTGRPDEVEQALLDAEVALAEARVYDAEDRWERVKEGPDPRTLEAAKERLQMAEAQVVAAEDALSNLELKAPFAGTIAEVRIEAEEWVAPGQPVVVIGNLDSLQIETTDLNEIDAARVSKGDAAKITLDAFPDLVVEGRVSYIAPKASEGSGVNYKVIVEFDEIPASVLWGMTAFVDIQVGP